MYRHAGRTKVRIIVPHHPPGQTRPPVHEPVAFSMHTDNGLLFELMGGSVRNDSMVVVANAVEEFLDSLSQRFSLVPAGTNVDFDLDFLRRLNLNPDAWLTYRKYDMATIRRLVTVLGAPDPYQGDSGPHRVKSCIARDIKDYKAMLETLAVKTGDHK